LLEGRDEKKRSVDARSGSTTENAAFRAGAKKPRTSGRCAAGKGGWAEGSGVGVEVAAFAAVVGRGGGLDEFHGGGAFLFDRVVDLHGDGHAVFLTGGAATSTGVADQGGVDRGRDVHAQVIGASGARIKARSGAEAKMRDASRRGWGEDPGGPDSGCRYRGFALVVLSEGWPQKGAKVAKRGAWKLGAFGVRCFV
jgi:hypothetical protein